MTLDPRLNAFRADLADARLQGQVASPRYVSGQPARIIAGLVPVRREPRADAAIDTFFHFGEPVLVFDERDGYAWCQSWRDSYVGYVEAAALAPGDGAAPTHYIAGMGAYRYVEPDLRAPIVDFLPRHSAVAIAAAGLECRGTRYVGLDGGGFLPVGCLAAEPLRSADLVVAAELYLGCPYLWGGRSFLGIDCSGLVQEGFRDLGIAVPRDSDMQRDAIGVAVRLNRPEELRRNDLVFIPGHVMIATGPAAVIHAYGGAMRVRRDPLPALMEKHGWRFADFTVRRPG